MRRYVIIATGLSGLALAGLAWSAREPAVVTLPPPPAPVAQPEEVADAATATLALALIATGVKPDNSDPFAYEIARIARGVLIRRPAGFRDDCSGFASAVFSQAGVPMDRDVWGLWEKAGENDALHWSTPRVGDLVFFDDTTDRNRDGEWNDDLTHVGVVIDLEPDGTVLFAHSGTSAGRTVGALNLDDPATDRDPDGRRINTWLREPRPGDPPTATYLAGELWAGFARVAADSDWL